MLKDTSKQTQKFKILDIEKSIAEYESDPANSSISASTYNTITKELENIKKIVGEEF